MNREQIEELFERSKNDRAIIVGSEVRQLCTLALRGLEAQWQPIETAPKDGSCFLACSGSWQTVCHWHRAAESWATNGPLYSLYPPDEPPTHWMPLPPAHGAKEPT